MLAHIFIKCRRYNDISEVGTKVDLVNHTNFDVFELDLSLASCQSICRTEFDLDDYAFFIQILERQPAT